MNDVKGGLRPALPYYLMKQTFPYQLRKRIETDIRAQSLCPPGARILVGVSGGADSVCLLDVLVRLSEQLGVTLHVAHLHHGIRGESADRDASFVEALAGRYGLSVTIGHRDVPAVAAAEGIGLEEAARDIRYVFFQEMAEETGADRVAVAHNREDQAETVLMHLFRGAGLQGLCGIAPIRPLDQGEPDGIQLIRPLLQVSRAEILRYDGESGLDWVTDETNADTAYTRNRLRQELLPVIRDSFGEAAVRHIAEAAGHLQQTRRELEMLRKGEARPVPEATEPEARIRKMPQAALGQLPGELRIPVLPERDAEQRLLLPGVGTLLCRLMAAAPVTEAVLIRQTDLCTKTLDYDKIKTALCVRTRRPGDYLILDAAGHRKSIKAIMRDDKLPVADRDHTPLLADPAGSRVYWIPALGRTDGSARAHAGQGTHLLLTLIPEKETM